MIRILLIEDNPVVREILRDMVVIQDDFDVVGTAENGLIALQLLQDGLEADIAIADLNMPGMGGIELSKNVTTLYSELKVIILTMHNKSAYLQHALSAGARGYLLKNGNMNELYDAIRRVNAGELIVGDDAND